MAPRMSLMKMSLAEELQAVLAKEPIDLARAALVIAKLEYPSLDPEPSLDHLDRLGTLARERVERGQVRSARACLDVVNRLLFEDEGFAGNRAHYDDFRNSLLNVVLERRLGIPITLGLVYMDVARRAGLDVAGVAFPGHFLLRAQSPGTGDALILDPFSGGVELDDQACRALLASRMGDDAQYDASLLRACTPRQFVARMLNNLKRTYVELRSFPQARRVTDLLLSADPMLLPELRDRGLLAYHLDDYPAALRDLEDYLRLQAWTTDGNHDERQQIWEHVKALRRRVASLN
jgi:regulator of sirC expression with transglutaminase-like and TPR domain